MNIAKKIAASVTIASLGLALLTSGVYALEVVDGDHGFGGGNGCAIIGNGAWSHNKCKITKKSKKIVKQSNKAHVTNNVWVDVNTGDNEANKNTWGDVTVDTGDATVEVTITNELNQNNNN
ncbi:hypothetical protein HY008_03795 [Candidatus Woesebacteria bacterium]|nr:hypothetical protein [Candidatus Woesebacteria bacterium]